MHGLEEDEVEPTDLVLAEDPGIDLASRTESMPFFDRDGLEFHFRDEGHGLPFVFQHGLGGDLNQPFGLYRPAAGVRLIAFDMRGHGETRPLGDVDKLTIATLADDLIGLPRSSRDRTGGVGGISLGAAVAVNVALRYPERVLGLVLVAAGVDRSTAARERSSLCDDRPLDPRARARGRARAVSDVARVSGDGTRVARLCPVARRPVRAAARRGMRGAAGATRRRYPLSRSSRLRAICRCRH